MLRGHAVPTSSTSAKVRMIGTAKGSTAVANRVGVSPGLREEHLPLLGNPQGFCAHPT